MRIALQSSDKTGASARALHPPAPSPHVRKRFRERKPRATKKVSQYKECTPQTEHEARKNYCTAVSTALLPV